MRRAGSRQLLDGKSDRWVASIELRSFDTRARCDALYLPQDEAALLARVGHDGSVAVSVVGPLDVALRKVFAAPAYYARVALRAERARALLGVPLNELTNRVVPLQDVCAGVGQSLRERIAYVDRDRAVSLLTAFVAELGARARGIDETLPERARLALLGGATSVGAVATGLGVSGRHLRRLFLEHFGMTPKRLARIARLRAAIALRRRMSWADAALEAGFFDQAHLTRDARDLLQASPETFWKQADRQARD